MARFVNWLKSPEGRSYFFSTHFWGPVANWGLPLAAISDAINKDETVISGVMSPTLAVYSMIFMRFAWMVKPRNYLLFACHTTNALTQSYQEMRYINYYYLGGREKRHPVASKVEDAAEAVKEKASEVTGAVNKAIEEAKQAANKA